MADRGCEIGQFADARRFVIAETGSRALMAGGSLRFGEHQECVAIAIQPDFPALQHMSGRLAFLPQPLFAATVKRDEPRLQRPLQRFLIHVAEHQDPERARLLHDGRDKAVSLRPVDGVDLECGRNSNHGRTIIPCSAQKLLHFADCISLPVKDPRGQGAVDPRIAKRRKKMLLCSGAARCDEGNGDGLAHRAQYARCHNRRACRPGPCN